MNNLSASPDILVCILRELDADHSLPGYRTAMLAFMRLLEISLEIPVVMLAWRLQRPYDIGTDADTNAFAHWIYVTSWKQIPREQKIKLAAEARERCE